MHYVEVQRPRVIKDENGKFLKDGNGYYVTVPDWFVMHVSDVKKVQPTRCVYCHSDVVLHNGGNVLHAHVEHKSKTAENAQKCLSREKDFNEEEYLIAAGKLSKPI